MLPSLYSQPAIAIVIGDASVTGALRSEATFWR